MKNLTAIIFIFVLAISLSAQTKINKKKLRAKKPVKVIKNPKECESIVSFGVIRQDSDNDIPKPKYPASARAINLEDDVSVQVIVNKKGKVLQANILKGHIFLRKVCLDSAMKSNLKIITLSSIPICYTAIIVYKFRK
jgi:Gram-negative bacterial TonB protein C-terminal